MAERFELVEKAIIKMLEDKSVAVSETAAFVLKRLERLKDRGEYKGEAIL